MLRSAFLIVVCLACLSGCATPIQRNDWSNYDGPGAEHFRAEEYELPYLPDPLEPANRIIWDANKVMLDAVAPASRAWRGAIKPKDREGLMNLFDNWRYPIRSVNFLLQGKFDEANTSTKRFLINTFLGRGGIRDRATEDGIMPVTTDMGWTLYDWGWQRSAYLMMPMFGPSTVRDALGFTGDSVLDPVTYAFGGSPLDFNRRPYNNPLQPARSFVELSERIELFQGSIRANFDAYATARSIWMIDRVRLPGPFENVREDTAATQTLAYGFFFPGDFRFAANRKTRTIHLDSTGREFSYELWLQPKPAPIVYIVPGLGAHRSAPGTMAMAEFIYNGGYSVVSISSTMNFDFMQSAATVPVPGLAPVDSMDVHVALTAIDRDITVAHPDQITGRAIMGISLGGFQALFIAASEKDADDGLVSFDRYLVISSPVRFLHAARQLDRFFNAPLAFPKEQRDARAFNALQKAIRSGLSGAPTNGGPAAFDNFDAEFLIGLTYRLALHDVIWVSQTQHDMGVLKSQRKPSRRNEASQEILDFSYTEYLYAFVLPYFVKHSDDVTKAQDLFQLSDLKPKTDSLRANDKIRIFASANDILLEPQDVDWFTEIFGEEHVFLSKRGGHLGQLLSRDVQKQILSTLDGLGADR